MNKIKNFINYAKKLSEEREIWQIAFRQKAEKPLYKGNGDGFILIPNSTRYWRADPFVFKYKNENFLFAEMFDRKKQKGVIGVAKLKKNRCGRFRVCLDLEYHLSYPCVFENKDGIFMIPECYSSGEISMYRCVDFPLKWEKFKVLKKCPGVDTTPVFDGNKEISGYYTSLFDKESGGNNNLYYFKENEELIQVFLNDTKCRCAGHLIEDDEVIRPIQDDTVTYGNSMYFAKINRGEENKSKEQKYLHIIPPKSKCGEDEAAVSLVHNDEKVSYIGVHTYNSNKDYEVIDLLVACQKNWLVLKQNRQKLIGKYFKKIKG